jgi:hypothetical protein
MNDKFEFGSWPLDEVDDDAIEAIEQAIQDLAREGLIVDTGQRRWSARAGRYEIDFSDIALARAASASRESGPAQYW